MWDSSTGGSTCSKWRKKIELVVAQITSVMRVARGDGHPDVLAAVINLAPNLVLVVVLVVADRLAFLDRYSKTGGYPIRRAS